MLHKYTINIFGVATRCNWNSSLVSKWNQTCISSSFFRLANVIKEPIHLANGNMPFVVFTLALVLNYHLISVAAVLGWLEWRWHPARVESQIEEQFPRRTDAQPLLSLGFVPTRVPSWPTVCGYSYESLSHCCSAQSHTFAAGSRTHFSYSRPLSSAGGATRRRWWWGSWKYFIFSQWNMYDLYFWLEMSWKCQNDLSTYFVKVLTLKSGFSSFSFLLWRVALTHTPWGTG